MISAEEIKRLKGEGVLNHRGTDLFSARIPTGNGKVTADKLECVAEAARRFGNGEVAFTTRQTMEVQDIPFDKVAAFQAFIAKAGLSTGGTGPLVRPVVCCKGTTCKYGLYDTYALALEIHRRFYVGWHDAKLPHKFKIAVGGCPNNCVKPDLNDIGIVGQRVPAFDVSKCKGCAVCKVAGVCPVCAATSSPDRRVRWDSAKCLHCGRCSQACPFGVVSSVTGFAVIIGGHWGKTGERGRNLGRVYTTADEVLALITRALNYYRENGKPGERFGAMIDRIGFGPVKAALV